MNLEVCAGKRGSRVRVVGKDVTCALSMEESRSDVPAYETQDLKLGGTAVELSSLIVKAIRDLFF